jgi:periplasmic copper chaperone A
MIMKIVTYTCGAIWLFFAANLFAQSAYKAGDIEVSHPWTWNTPPGAKVGGAFFTLRSGASADKLVGAESAIAGKTEIHTHAIENGVMRMRAISHIEIGAGKSVELKPGGFHIMFFDLKKQLDPGINIPLTLTFEKAGKIQVEVVVEDRAIGKGASNHTGHKH